MSQACVDVKPFIAGEALAKHRRVKLSAPKTVSYAGADEKAVGVTAAAAASGANVSVELLGGRTHMCTAAGVVVVAATIYAMASGKVDDTATGSGSAAIGVALEAAQADGDIIECILNADVA